MWFTPIAKIIQRFFYTFLDISGILLGIFLAGLGCWILTGHAVSAALAGVLLFLGVCAFLIHTGHYFNLRITRWIFGSDTYFHKDQK